MPINVLWFGSRDAMALVVSVKIGLNGNSLEEEPSCYEVDVACS